MMQSLSRSDDLIAAYRAVLDQAFPDLMLTSMTVLGEGWDSVAFLVNDTLVFRLPKRAAVDRMLRRERLLLAGIGHLLPVPVPRYTHVSEPIPGFPYGVAGYQLIKGRPLSKLDNERLNLASLASELAQFLTALHAIDPKRVGTEALVPITPEIWWSERLRLFERASPRIESILPKSISSVYAASWNRAFDVARRIGFSPCLVHLDLAAEHVLLTPAGHIAGIIDFGDTEFGDPAIDVAGLPDELAEAVIDRYTDDSVKRRDLWKRRAFYRLMVPLHAIVAGINLDRRDLLHEGLGLVQTSVLTADMGRHGR